MIPLNDILENSKLWRHKLYLCFPEAGVRKEINDVGAQGNSRVMGILYILIVVVVTWFTFVKK